MMKHILLLSALLTWAVTSAGQNKNYDESQVPTFEVPDALTCSDGTRVKTRKQWENKRRPELMKLLSEQEYGFTPWQTGIRAKYELVATNTDAGDRSSKPQKCRSVRY